MKKEFNVANFQSIINIDENEVAIFKHENGNLLGISCSYLNETMEENFNENGWLVPDMFNEGEFVMLVD